MTTQTFVSLTKALFEFGEYYPTVKDLGLKDGSYRDYKKHIDVFISRYPEFEGKLLVLYGQRTFLKNRAAFFDECECPNPNNTMKNFCILTRDDLVVYLNAKIFDIERLNFFEILTLESISNEWFVMADNIGSIEHLDQLENELLYMTREWHLKAYPGISEEDVFDAIDRARFDGIRSYSQVCKDVNNQCIIFNGTKENNPYIKKMYGLYKEKFSPIESLKNMKNEVSAQAVATKSLLVGKYFHVFGENKQVSLQGVVIDIIYDQYVLVQYFDWIVGKKSTMEIISIKSMANGASFSKFEPPSFQFYDTMQEMQDWYKEHLHYITA